MTQRYFGLLTKIGENKQAAAQALNRIVQITHMAVGDANGAQPVPDREQEALIHETRRAPLNTLKQDPANPNYLIAEQVIPEDAGGWYIRELGLYDAAGDLVAVANCPETYKPLLAEGSGRAQVVRLILMVASTSAFELKIDPAVVLATRQYVDDKLHKNVSISGGATADPVAIDGTGDIQINVKSLDVGKANAGTLAVKRGGTGLTTVAAGSYLKGNNTDALVPMTPAELFQDLGIADYVKTRQGSYSGFFQLAASATLDLSHVGAYLKWITPATGVTVTLPDADVVPLGATFTITNANSSTSPLTVKTPHGIGSVIHGTAVTSISMPAGTEMEFVHIGDGTYELIKGAGVSLLQPNGYTRLPSGVLLQWGVFTMGAGQTSVTVTFPVAFTATPKVVGTHQGGGGAMFIVVGPPGTTSFQGAVTTSFNQLSGGTFSGHWHAIGY